MGRATAALIGRKGENGLGAGPGNWGRCSDGDISGFIGCCAPSLAAAGPDPGALQNP